MDKKTSGCGCLLLLVLLFVMCGVVGSLTDQDRKPSASSSTSIERPASSQSSVSNPSSSQAVKNRSVEHEYQPHIDAEIAKQRDEYEKRLAEFEKQEEEYRRLKNEAEKASNAVMELQQAAPPNPMVKYRLFTAANGKFSVQAKLVGIDLTENRITIERLDDQTQVVVDLDKLSENDAEFVKEAQKSLHVRQDHDRKVAEFESVREQAEQRLKNFSRSAQQPKQINTDEIRQQVIEQQEEFAQAARDAERQREQQAQAKADARSRRIEAWVMAQDFVKQNLKSPSTASFGSLFSDYQSPDDTVSVLGNGKYRVRGWVDSQNSFGAMLRTRFTCDLEYLGNDRWRCPSLVFDE